MRKLIAAAALAAGFVAAPVMAAEDPVWGPWASTDSDALAQILAVNSGSGLSTGLPQLGPADSALLDVGSLLDLLGRTVEQAGFDACDLLPVLCGGGGSFGSGLPVSADDLVGALSGALSDPTGGAGALDDLLP